MTPSTRPRVPHLLVAILGFITIAVYGSWAYSFGVLLDPIVVDTGWSEAGVVTVFSISAGVAGIGSIPVGWLLDRYGSRIVFLTGAVLGYGAFLGAANSESYIGFAALAALGGGVYGAFGFYPVTQTVAARLRVEASARSITVLTVWGAFAGAVYIPLAAWLVESGDWRSALVVLTGSASLMLVVGALAVPAAHFARSRTSLVAGVRGILAVPNVRNFILAVALTGVAVSILSVYQVPLMAAAGLSLTFASSIAGARSLAQLLGRLPLTPIVGRFGAHRALGSSFAAIGIGSLIVLTAGNLWLGIAFAVVAGYGIGSLSPLVGIHSVLLFPESGLGVGRGTVAAASNIAGTIGPVLAVAAISLTGSRTAASILAAGAAFGAILVMRGFSAPGQTAGIGTAGLGEAS